MQGFYCVSNYFFFFSVIYLQKPLNVKRASKCQFRWLMGAFIIFSDRKNISGNNNQFNEQINFQT